MKVWLEKNQSYVISYSARNRQESVEAKDNLPISIYYIDDLKQQIDLLKSIVKLDHPEIEKVNHFESGLTVILDKCVESKAQENKQLKERIQNILEGKEIPAICAKKYEEYEEQLQEQIDYKDEYYHYWQETKEENTILKETLKKTEEIVRKTLSYYLHRMSFDDVQKDDLQYNYWSKKAKKCEGVIRVIDQAKESMK